MKNVGTMNQIFRNAIKRYFVTLVFLGMLAFSSCNKTIPAGFWSNYKYDLIVKNISDHGPYGGHSAIYWKAGNTTKFTTSDILGFAANNGWSLVDSAVFTKEQTNKWMYSNQAVFPLTKTGFSDSVLNNAQLEHFPRWFVGQVKLYSFKTGWITIEPGTDNSIEKNGFVLLNEERTEMAVYFLWGE